METTTRLDTYKIVARFPRVDQPKVQIMIPEDFTLDGRDYLIVLNKG